MLKQTRFRWSVLLIGVVLLVDLPGFDWGLPATVAPHADDVARPALSALRQGFLEPTKYPRVHYAVLSLAYAPYLVSQWLAGGIDPDGMSDEAAGETALRDPVSFYTGILRIARATSLLAHIGCVLILYATLLYLTRRRGVAWLGAALFGLAPEVSLFARMSNVDLPMLFWVGAALLQYLRFLDRPLAGRLLGLAILAALAVGTKDQAAFLLAPLCLHAALLVIRRHPAGTLRGCRAALPAFLVGLFLWSLATGLLWAPVAAVERLSWWQDEMTEFAGRFDGSPELAGPFNLTRAVLARFLFVGGLGTALVTLMALLLLPFRRQPRALLLLVLLLAYPVLTFASIGFVQARYLLPAVYLAILFAGVQIGTQPLTALRSFGLPAALLVLLLNGSHALLIDRALLTEPRGEAVAWLEAHVARGSPVEVYENQNMLPPVEVSGQVAQRVYDFSIEGFTTRNPPIVLFTDGSSWNQDRRQQEYLATLASGPRGYLVQRFGPQARNSPTFFLAPETRVRIWPNITILMRR